MHVLLINQLMYTSLFTEGNTVTLIKYFSTSDIILATWINKEAADVYTAT